MEILILMLICHVLDDFVFQPVILSKLKQKKTWEGLDDQYADDYKMALFIHSLSWSCMIMLPFVLLSLIQNNVSDITFVSVLLVNTGIHYYVDDLKANKLKINLCTDQFVHLFQIFATFLILYS